MAAYVALNLATRMSMSQGRARVYWLIGGALAMGAGIWSMHFIGMLALRLPIPLSYDVSITLVSLLIAVLVSGFALFTINRSTLTMRRLFTSALFMGFGIAAMHYTGMAALPIVPSIRYDPSLFALSVAIAVATSIVALWIAFHLRSESITNIVAKRAGAALVMGVALAGTPRRRPFSGSALASGSAIVGMHYTGMAAANFAPDSVCIGGSPELSKAWMTTTIASCIVLLLVGTVLISGREEAMATKGRALSIRLRLSLAFVMVSLMVAAFAVAVLKTQIATSERAAILEAEHVAQAIALAGGQYALEAPGFIQNYMRIAQKLYHRDLFVVDANKRIVADTNPEEIGTLYSNDPEDIIGSTMGDGRTRSLMETVGSPPVEMMQVVIPLRRDQSDTTSPIVGALILEYTNIFNDLIAEAHSMIYLVAAIGIALVFVTAALGFRVTSAIARPLAELERGVRELAAGDYEARVKVGSRDEVGRLASAFNKMAGDLSVVHGELVGQQSVLEQRIATSIAEFQLITDHMPAMMSYLDAERRYHYHNKRLEQWMGLTADEIDGRHITEVLGKENYAAVEGWIDKALSGKQVSFERAHLRRDGKRQYISTDLVPRFGDEGKVIGYYAMTQDISVRREAEAALMQRNDELKRINQQLSETQNQLLQSEKLASIGQLAAGVAHEINNPIGYVNSNLSSLERYYKQVFGVLDVYEEAEPSISDAKVSARIAAAKEEADLRFVREDIAAVMVESRDGISRVKKIVRDLKDFSRVDARQEWQFVNLHEGIDSTLNIVNNEIKYKADVVREYGTLPEIECLSSQVNQVVMNLLVNAAHAIGEERGRITIRTGCEGQEAWFEVADNGVGIPVEIQSRIFDPFFTTKAIGKGTGLGLSLSYGIVQKHHGRIEVASAVGRGATFRVWLPVRRAKEKTAMNLVADAGSEVPTAVPEVCVD